MAQLIQPLEVIQGGTARPSPADIRLDKTLVSPHIQVAEFRWVKDAIGASFYNALVAEKGDSSAFTTSAYQTLWDTNLKALCANSVLYEAAPYIVMQLGTNGLYLIDKLGRKKLMYIGSFGYIIFLSLMAYNFLGPGIPSFWLPLFVFGFIASHAVGQGSVIWVFISEMFPNELRAYGQSLGSFTHWILAAVIANVFPFFANSYGPGVIFAFFCAMMVLQLLWVRFAMPETKGRSLEEIQKDLQKNHV
jgi:MFS family permease